MPIYEYACSKCHHTCDFLQGINDPDQTKCPQCDQDTLKRQVSAPNFHLKGSGWYATDFKDNNKTKADSPKKEKSQKTDNNSTPSKKTNKDQKQ